MNTIRTKLTKSIAMLLALSVLAFAFTNAVAANRIFGLHLKNGLLQPITFKITMQSCYQGTGAYPPHKVSHGPVQPGQSIKIDIARVQGNGCDGQNGNFEVTPVGRGIL